MPLLKIWGNPTSARVADKRALMVRMAISVFISSSNWIVSLSVFAGVGWGKVRNCLFKKKHEMRGRLG